MVFGLLTFFITNIFFVIAGQSDCQPIYPAQCNSCASTYNYKSVVCLDNCPKGYNENSNTCVEDVTSSKTFMDVRFYQIHDFTQSTVDYFQASNSFDHSSKLQPIPTKERGFYFFQTSSLTGIALDIIGPDLTIKLLIRVTSCDYDDHCIIFSYNPPGSQFDLYVNSSHISSNWMLNSMSSSSQTTKTFETPFELHKWQKFVLVCEQSLSGITIKHIYLENYEYATNELILAGLENSIKRVMNNFQFGDMTQSFSGFLYYVTGKNSIDNTFDISVYLIDCEFNEYYFHPQCLPCDSSCSSWPWCVRKGSCTSNYDKVCYNSNCGTCTGYNYYECASKSNFCWKFCDSGQCETSNPFKCTACSSQYSLIEGLCIYLPFRYDSSGPAVSLSFNTFEQYYDGVFQSGRDPSTYAPYHNPDKDDPVPMKNRGLYFTNSSSLRSISQISLNHKNTFLIWAKPQGIGFNFWNAPSILLHGTGVSSLLLTDTEHWARFNSFEKDSSISDWTYYSFVHDFESTSGTFYSKIYLNNVLFSSYSANGYALYDIRTTVYILGEGFLYSLNVYNKVLSNDIIQDGFNEVCFSPSDENCIWSCKKDEYLNDNGDCTKCDESCNSGCVKAGSCGLCINEECLSCPGFPSSTCLSYPQYDDCAPNWDNFENYNNCCSEGCKTCDGPFEYSCKTCIDDLVLVNELCLENCPTGYYKRNGVCILSNELIVDFTFNTIYDIYVDKRHDVTFSTGFDESYYPDQLPSDPIPAKNRGLYFKSTSYMTSSNITMSPTFTIVFWIRHQAGGVLISKGFFSINTLSSIMVSITPSSAFTSPSLDYDEWTHLVVKVWNAKDGKINGLVSSLTEKKTSYLGSYDYFLDNESPIILGDSDSSFVGFIYKFQVYSVNFDVSELDPESICPKGSIEGCLWICGIDDFWDGYDCFSCDENCSSGCKVQGFCNICHDKKCHNCHDYTSTCDICKNHATLHSDSNCQCTARYYWESDSESCLPCNDSCTLCDGPTSSDCLNCLDPHCVDCTYYSLKTCIQCQENFQVVDSQCELCDEEQYYDSQTLTCKNCPSPCQTCTSNKKCYSCMENSNLKENGMCECDLGYALDEICERTTFTSVYSISNKNVIKINFLEPLHSELKTSDLKVFVTTSDVDIELEKIDMSKWMLHLNLKKPASKKSRINIDIVSQLLSTKNSIFINKHYTALLFVTESDDTLAVVEEATTLAKGTLGVAMATVIGTSIVVADPKSLFFFLQMLEMYYYILIYLVKISSSLDAFLKILNPASLLPNIMEYIIPRYYGNPVSSNLYDFGYETNLFMLNSSSNIILIWWFTILFPIAYLVKKIPCIWLKHKMDKITNSYRFGVIARCYVQMFLEFFLNSFIGIFFTAYSNSVQIIDFALCIIVLVLFT